MARHKKPIELKKLHGTYRKDRDSGAMSADPVSSLECPELLKDEARGEWDRITRQLSANNMLYDVDYPLLVSYCQKIGEYYNCVKSVQEGGYFFEIKDSKGQIKSITKNPAVAIGNEALKIAIGLAAQFGVSPAARAKIKINKKVEEEDPFEKLMNASR